MSNTTLQNLTEIFNERIFRIPDYQRGYSWQEKQLEDFWEDLEALRDGKKHYTGMLTVDPINEEDVMHHDAWQDDKWLLSSGVSAAYVIDGQQRLTTAIILINEILDQYDNDELIGTKTKAFWSDKFLFQQLDSTYASFVFGYEKDNPSDAFFKKKILGKASSASDKDPERTLYTANLLSAKNFFRERLANKSKEELPELFNKVTRGLLFNYYPVKDLDVYMTFETMNNRGKPLSSLELLKNRLIYLTTLMSDEEIARRLRNDINQAWKVVYEYLGKTDTKSSDDDAFLRSHWIIVFGYDSSRPGAYTNFLLNKYFTAKRMLSEELTTDDIKKYIESLTRTVKFWFYLYNPEMASYGPEAKEWLRKLNRLGMSAFPPLLIAGMLVCDDEEKLIKLFQSVERFIFLVFRISQRKSNTKNSHFYRKGHELFTHYQSIERIIDDIEWLCDGYDEKDGEYYGWFNLNHFHEHIKQLFIYNQGYHSWSGLRYFLYEYELHLQQRERGDTVRVRWEDITGAIDETVEHIYPQNPQKGTWKIGFDKLTLKEKKAHLHSLGNLLLLSRSKNSSLQNNSFEKKRDGIEGKDCGYYNGSQSEIQVAQNKSWTPNKIAKRGIELLKFMEERWNILINKREWDVNKGELLMLAKKK